jgi:hypothetical protein
LYLQARIGRNRPLLNTTASKTGQRWEEKV